MTGDGGRPGFVGLLMPVEGAPGISWVTSSGDYRARFEGRQGALSGWPLPIKWVDAVGGHGLAWCGERRRRVDLPQNRAAFLVAARLGCPDLADRIGLHGDLLLAGIDSCGGLADVPPVVVSAAAQAGLLPELDADLEADLDLGADPWSSFPR